jgi:hypothetical protein
VNNWERGKGISRENIRKIAECYGVWVDWLMNGPEDSPIQFVATAQAEQRAALPDRAVWTVAVDEMLRVMGLTPQIAGELVAMIERTATANSTAFPGMTAEETTRMVVRRLVEILAKP